MSLHTCTDTEESDTDSVMSSSYSLIALPDEAPEDSFTPDDLQPNSEVEMSTEHEEQMV